MTNDKPQNILVGEETTTISSLSKELKENKRVTEDYSKLLQTSLRNLATSMGDITRGIDATLNFGFLRGVTSVERMAGLVAANQRKDEEYQKAKKKQEEEKEQLRKNLQELKKKYSDVSDSNLKSIGEEIKRLEAMRDATSDLADKVEFNKLIERNTKELEELKQVNKGKLYLQVQKLEDNIKAIEEKEKEEKKKNEKLQKIIKEQKEKLEKIETKNNDKLSKIEKEFEWFKNNKFKTDKEKRLYELKKKDFEESELSKFLRGNSDFKGIKGILDNALGKMGFGKAVKWFDQAQKLYKGVFRKEKWDEETQSWKKSKRYYLNKQKEVDKYTKQIEEAEAQGYTPGGAAAKELEALKARRDKLKLELDTDEYWQETLYKEGLNNNYRNLRNNNLYNAQADEFLKITGIDIRQLKKFGLVLNKMNPEDIAGREHAANLMAQFIETGKAPTELVDAYASLASVLLDSGMVVNADGSVTKVKMAGGKAYGEQKDEQEQPIYDQLENRWKSKSDGSDGSRALLPKISETNTHLKTISGHTKESAHQLKDSKKWLSGLGGMFGGLGKGAATAGLVKSAGVVAGGVVSLITGYGLGTLINDISKYILGEDDGLSDMLGRLFSKFDKNKDVGKTDETLMDSLADTDKKNKPEGERRRNAELYMLEQRKGWNEHTPLRLKMLSAKQAEDFYNLSGFAEEFLKKEASQEMERKWHEWSDADYTIRRSNKEHELYTAMREYNNKKNSAQNGTSGGQNITINAPSSNTNNTITAGGGAVHNPNGVLDSVQRSDLATSNA